MWISLTVLMMKFRGFSMYFLSELWSGNYNSICFRVQLSSWPFYFRRMCFPAFDFLIWEIIAPKNTHPVFDWALKLVLFQNFVYTHNVCSYTNNKLCLSEFCLVFGVRCHFFRYNDLSLLYWLIIIISLFLLSSDDF